MLKRFSLLCALVAGLIIVSASTRADEVTVSSGVRSVEVRYDTDEIRSDAGARAFLARLEDAAAIVCGPAPEASDSEAGDGYGLCILIARDSALAQAGGPLFADESEASASLATIAQ